MSGSDEMASVVDEDDSMIKYFREKIIGRPGIFPRSGDLPIEDTTSSIKRTTSQNSLNDLISNDPIAQVEKLSATASVISSGRRPIISSSPIIIPRKPPRSNASSQSSSSYTSVVDQTSSFGESDDVPNATFPTFPSTCQLLEHSAARDRISVKNKRRQPIKQKLSTLRETDDNEIDLFSLKAEDDDEIPPPLPPKQRHLLKGSLSLPTPTNIVTTNPTTKPKKKKTPPISSTPEEETSIPSSTRVETKVQQPLIDLSVLDAARTRLRMSVRPRDRSADNILLATHSNFDLPSNPPPILPKLPSLMQRSVSFKRPQEINKGESFNRPIFKSKNTDNPTIPTKPIENESSSSENQTLINSSATQSMSRSSSQEHIYDNLDVFKRSKPNGDDSSATPVVKTREHPLPTPRLRPVTMHIPPNNEKQTTNEFENVFNQLKKRGSIRRVRPGEEPIPEPPPPPVEETPAPPPPPPVKETPVPPPPPLKETPVPPPPPTKETPVLPPAPPPENEPIVPINKPVETTPLPPTPTRRKTVGGVHLPASNKVATDDNKPAPSWIDIAKQKHNKFQSVTNEKQPSTEVEQQTSTEPVAVITRKQVSTADIRSNRKSMFEQSTNANNAHVIERDSIRALKAGNPNRINNLIQFFDK